MTDECTIAADDDLSNLKRIGLQTRYGNWHVTFRGLNLYCHDLLSLHTALKDIFIQRIYDFNADSQSPFVIDGGAHIGLFSLYAKLKYPKARVIAYEPEERSVGLCMKNLMANGIRDVRVIPAGLFETDGTLAFESRPNDGSNLFSTQANASIQVRRLSPYLSEQVDFLKLNIEGAEWGVLREIAPVLRNVKALALEYHGFPEIGQKLHHILGLLDEAGFRYSIHDFDAQTNPATKPPIKLDAKTRFYLLVNAVRLNEAERATLAG